MKNYSFVLAGLLLLSSCVGDGSELTSIKFLNEKGCSVFCFEDTVSKSNYGLNSNVDVVTVSSFDNLPTYGKDYEFVWIDCSKYQNVLTGKDFQLLYEWITDYSFKRAIILYDNPNTSFFEGSPFESKFGLYIGSEGLASLFYNYYFQSLHFFEKDSGDSMGFSVCVDCMYGLVLEYVRSL